MPRQIISTAQIGALVAPPPATPDPYVSKLLKLIPADIISVYLTVFNMVKSSSTNKDGNQSLQWIIFIIITVITPFYLKKVAGIDSTMHIILCMLSFFVWVLTLGGPLDGQLILGNNSPQFIGALILPIFTLVAPIIYKP